MTQNAGLADELAALADDDGLIRRPIIDQWGRTVGVDYTSPADLARVDAITDGLTGTVWTPPTADAYFRACMTIKRLEAEIAALRATHPETTT